MKPFLLLICINPNLLGCDIIFRDYFPTREECVASLQAQKLAPQATAVCIYDPDKKY